MEFRRDASMLNVRMGPGVELPGSAPSWASPALGRASCSFYRDIVLCSLPAESREISRSKQCGELQSEGSIF